LGHRFYWPELPRFIQQDPIGDDINWYAYAANNPVRFIDPEGTSWREAWETARALGSWHGSWKAMFSKPNWSRGGYYECYLRGMVGLPSLPGHLATAYNVKGLGPLWTARSYYHFTDRRFTAWGKHSKVLVPNLVKRIGPWAGRASALATASWYPQSLYYMGKCSPRLRY